ncbi:MAG TPA: RNase adapter RapZ [Candidatus Binataceae bacterium]|nr:RNase adapter RapZ [Candidatus Binataceae bacterium]
MSKRERKSRHKSADKARAKSKSAAKVRPKPKRDGDASGKAARAAAKSAKKIRLIIVTGVAGSGRSSAMRVLEDLGFYCVDNLPVALALNVLRLAAAHKPDTDRVALGIDPRERLFFPQWPGTFDELERQGFVPEILFLDAADEVLARRYSESRRPHPLAESGRSIGDSIGRERLALAEMRDRATRVIDTTATTVHELREIITASVMGDPRGERMAITLISFGYKYGNPMGLDLVFDARFIPNPFFVPELRALDGADVRVHGHVMSHPEARRFLTDVGKLLEFLIPLYRREGKSYLSIGIGCTGGRHRSPVIARELQTRLAHGGFQVQVRDHDLSR